MHTLILTAIHGSLNRRLQLGLYCLCFHILQSNREILMDRRQKMLHTYLTSITGSHFFPIHIHKLQYGLTLHVKHPLPNNTFKSRSLWLELSTKSSSWKSSIEVEKMMQLIKVNQSGETIGKEKEKREWKKGKGGSKKNWRRRQRLNQNSQLFAKMKKNEIIAGNAQRLGSDPATVI